MSYTIFKFLHLAGIVLFLGNIIVTALWKSRADRTENQAVIHYSSHLVIVTDYVFTVGGVVLLLIGGLGMMYAVGMENLSGGWLHLGITLFAASAVIWFVKLIPTQKRMKALSGPEAAWPSEAYRHEAKQWMVWGGVATLLPIINMVLMVFKPF